MNISAGRREKPESISGDVYRRLDEFGFNFNETGEMTQCTVVQSMHGSVVSISVHSDSSQ